MSDMRMALAVAAVLLFLPAALPAQQSDSGSAARPSRAGGAQDITRQRQELRIDSLAARVTAIDAEIARMADSIRAAEGALDSVRVNGVLLVGRDATVAEAVPHARAALTRLGPAATAALAGHVFLIHGSETQDYLADHRGRADHHRINLRSARSGADRAQAVERGISAVASGLLPSQITQWVGVTEALVPPDSAWTWRWMALSRSSVARRCIDGDAAACLPALGLTEAGPGWSRWYTPGELREIVARQGATGTDRCVAGDHAACVRYLEERPGLPGPPLDPLLRRSVLSLILARRGTAAVDTLLAGGDRPVPELLAAAYGRPLPELVEDWQQNLENYRRPHTADLATASAAALAWILVFGALATRSTRWRLG